MVQLVNALDNRILRMRSRTSIEDALTTRWLSEVVVKQPKRHYHSSKDNMVKEEDDEVSNTE